MLDKLQKSREHAIQGMCKDATEVSQDMRKNMDYKVKVTKDAEEDLECFVRYLMVEKGNIPAAER